MPDLDLPDLDPSDAPYDALLLVSFGGPEGPDDVLPFMENVTRGRGIPRERLVEVSAHYQRFGGVSPINAQNRLLIAALESELAAHRLALRVYWGNRNWDPLLPDAVERMRADGVRRAIAFVTSAFSSYSGCRQYREDIERARAVVGAGAPVIDKLRVFYNHPGFLAPMVDNVVDAVRALERAQHVASHLVFSAHSLPLAMADSSDYVVQLQDASALVAYGVAARLGRVIPWGLCFQSRSGAPGQPWLEPDVSDRLEELAATGATGAVVVPIGFISDHMEVVYDLDTVARERATAIDLPMMRAATVGNDPRFVTMIRLLVEERIAGRGEGVVTRSCLGARGANHDVCPFDCCPAPARPTPPSNAQR